MNNNSGFVDPISLMLFAVFGGAAGYLGYNFGVKTCGIMPLVMTAGCSIFGTLLLVRSGLTDLAADTIREKVSQIRERRRMRLARRVKDIKAEPIKEDADNDKAS